MKYFHIDSEMNDKLLKRFYDFCNENEDDEWTISISSVGGITSVGKTVIYIINKRPERCTLICHEAYSSGFEIFYRTKCKKILVETCKGMVHKSSVKMLLNSGFKPIYLEDICVAKNWKESNSLLDMVERFLTNKEMKEFKIGNEVYFTTNRMKEIFPDAEII